MNVQSETTITVDVSEDDAGEAFEIIEDALLDAGILFNMVRGVS